MNNTLYPQFQPDEDSLLRKSNSVESVHSKRYLSALQSDVLVDGRPSPEGAECGTPPAVPPRLDKMDINSG